ncbi:MAG: competence/damage-inducible protein A [Actinomycetota bacterium]|nr:competence/damage-inducible protein A [Actinomycetota bacterium]
MNAEIIGVGTELLLGQIANTNAQRISQALASIGVDVYRHTAVGDNLTRATESIEEALGRAGVVIITGGLGPTPDDLTRDAIAAALGLELERDPDLVEGLKAFFAGRNRAMPEDNLKQADLPHGAHVIAPEGTAPGFYLERDGRLVFALPGVPWEMEGMLTKTVLPVLRERAGKQVTISREVIVLGLGESSVHDRIRELVDAQTNPTIAYLAGFGQVRVRLTAKGGSEAEALAVISPIEEKVRDLLGEDAVEGHHGSLAVALGAMLRDRGANVAVAESLTGGLIAAELTNVGGSGDYFLGSLVCYTTEAKGTVAGIDEAILMGPGAVSEEAAAALAEAAISRFDADLGLSATGVAGPAEQEGVPVGVIYVGATFGGRTEVRKVRGYGDRHNVRCFAVTAALDLGRRVLLRHG